MCAYRGMGRFLLLMMMVAGCDSNGGRGTTGATTSATTGGGGADLAELPLTFDDGGLPPATLCASDPKACYTVYAHGDHVLYKIDLMAKTLVTVGPFNAPKIMSGKEDVITDLAVSPSDVIYAISNTQLYTADATDGHVTTVGAVTNCGMIAVAMTFGPDGTLYAGDF